MTTSRQWAREWIHRGHRPYVKTLRRVADLALGQVLAANPQTLSDLIPQRQIATLGAGSRIQHNLQELLAETF